MDINTNIKKIGTIHGRDFNFTLNLDNEYIKGLTEIKGFSHLQILWWAHAVSENDRNRLLETKPYTKGPDTIGTFATRSPLRPNPILLTTIYVQKLDLEKGIIHTPYIDADDGSPILDIKPYHLIERVQNCQVPDWCSHWPAYYEEAGNFNWEAEFNFSL